jgi:hypothetical protein
VPAETPEALRRWAFNLRRRAAQGVRSPVLGRERRLACLRAPSVLAALAAAGGAAIVRVHDVEETVHFLDMRQAIAHAPSTAGAPAKAPAQ